MSTTAKLNGHAKTGNGRATVAHCAPWERLLQCQRCRVRLSGPLAGWRSARALPDYKQILCNACRYELQARAPS